MFLDNKEEFQTVWQLAHNWVDANPAETDANAVSLELKTAIHRLMNAMACREISARTRKWIIFEGNSFLSLPFDLFHYLEFIQSLKKDKFKKIYLDNLYVKRNEVLSWCENVAYLDPPPCWMPKQLPDGQIISKEIKNHRPKEETEDRIRCQAIACALWDLDPNIHPKHLAKSEIMRRFGNGRQYNEDTVKNWIAEVDPQKDQRKSGRPPDIEYKIVLKTDPQLNN